MTPQPGLHRAGAVPGPARVCSASDVGAVPSRVHRETGTSALEFLQLIALLRSSENHRSVLSERKPV
jgi:hypothetical protein